MPTQLWIPEEKILIENNRAQLILWDTPGFGGVNAAHIEERIRAAGTAKGWLKSQVIDRIANRSLYSSVEAAKNIRLKADIVLYLVDNRCSPGEAGYLKGELALLQTLKRPVIVLINHLDSQGEEIQKDVLKTWEASCGDYDVVKGIVVLDAFSRIWLQELSLLEEINNALPEEQRASMTSLNAEYKEQQERIESACMMEIAGLIDFARSQKVDLKDGPDKKEIFRRLFIPWMADFRRSSLKWYCSIILMLKNPPSSRPISVCCRQKLNKIPEKTAGLISGAVAGAGGGWRPTCYLEGLLSAVELWLALCLEA